MPRVTEGLKQGKHWAWIFECPGCGSNHFADDRWKFNGDIEHPSFTPSIRVSHRSPEGKEHVCHFHVTNGAIAYCNDCTHELRGKTVPLPELN